MGRVIERSQILSQLNEHAVGASWRNEGVDSSFLLAEVLVNHSNSSLFQRVDLVDEVPGLKRNVVKPLPASFEVFGEEALRIDRFQKFDAQVAQVEDCETKVAAVVVCHGAQRGSHMSLPKRQGGIDVVNRKPDVIEVSDRFSGRQDVLLVREMRLLRCIRLTARPSREPTTW